MYRSAKFKAKEQAEGLEFMNKNPFIILIGYGLQLFPCSCERVSLTDPVSL